jgi:hypothetical protein
MNRALKLPEEPSRSRSRSRRIITSSSKMMNSSFCNRRRHRPLTFQALREPALEKEQLIAFLASLTDSRFAQSQ